MRVVFNRVAGLDVGKASLTVCIRTPGRTGGRHQETRTFMTTAGSLRLLRDWLLEQQVTNRGDRVDVDVLEATVLLPGGGPEVWLLNASHMKAVPGWKTDVRDPGGTRNLLEHGLLSPSFVPSPEIRSLRLLTRYRVQLMGDRSREIIRLETMLEDASIKLSSVASSLSTVSARVILAAMIAGEQDPLVLADLAKGRLRSKIPELGQALEGRLDRHHAQLVGAIIARARHCRQGHS